MWGLLLVCVDCGGGYVVTVCVLSTIEGTGCVAGKTPGIIPSGGSRGRGGILRNATSGDGLSVVAVYGTEFPLLSDEIQGNGGGIVPFDTKWTSE